MRVIEFMDEVTVALSTKSGAVLTSKVLGVTRDD
jgi:hypothetical protein